jgi:MFS family permease
VRYYLGQLLANSAYTIITLYYPLKYYELTGSTFDLSLMITYYSVMNALGSYFWGWVVDNTRVRKPLFVIYVVSGVPLSFALSTGLYPYFYGLVGFASALGGPLYSTFMLERFDVENLPKQNALLSIASLGGNVIGSVIVVHSPLRAELIVTLFLAATLTNATLIPSYSGEVRADKAERVQDFRDTLIPILIFFAFNSSTEVFYILYIPLLKEKGIPTDYYFMSYTGLYLLEIAMFYVAPKIVKGLEGFTAGLSILGRSLVIYWILSDLPVNEFSVLVLFLSFGSLWSIFSTSYFSLVLSNLKKNRGQVVGLINAFGDVGSSLGSFVPSILSGFPLEASYQVSFVGFVISGALWVTYVRALKTPSSSGPLGKASSRPRSKARIPAFLKASRSHRF